MFSQTLLQTIVSAVVTLSIIVVVYVKWTYGYWKRKNLPHLESRGFYGSLGSPVKRKENFGIILKNIYNTMRQNKWKHGGFYLTLDHVYMVTDLEYVRNVMSKDFQYFVDRGIYHNEKDDPLSAHLFAIGGQKWRNLRTKMTPTFTSGKMKTMFQVLVDCEDQLLSKVEADCVENKPIDIKEALARFTTNIIGSCAFGLELDTFAEEDSLFRKYGKMVFSRSSRLRTIKATFANSFPDFAKKIGVVLTPKEISNFFLKLIRDTVNYRETNNYQRKDFLQILIDLKNNVNENNEKSPGQTLTIEEVAAQCFVFFLAGFETSSTTMTFALYELAKNQEIQDKVRAEILEVLAKHNNKVTYEAIQDMKYMNQVIDETLRIYPPVSFVTRRCVKDYKVPDTDMVIEKGTRVIIPILGIQHDEEYYPDPDKFDPERFTEENKQTRHSFAHIPFGEGPRLCIGMRFGLMQSKVGLTALLKNYKFTVSSKTQEPLVMEPKSFVLAAKGEVWLNAQKI